MKPNWSLLAGLRFVLALAVVGRHAPELCKLDGLGAWSGGSAAVLMFLLVSGYSIAHSLERGAQGFLARRAWRIYPCYVIGVALACAAAPQSLGTVAGLLTMMQGVLIVAPMANVALWSLSLEWWLYVAATKLTTKSASVLTALLIVTSLIPRSTPLYELKGFAALLFVGHFWLAGFLWQRKQYALPIIGSVVAVGQALFTQGFTPAFGGLAWVFGLGWVVFALATIKPPTWASKPLELLGDLSYPLYALHVPVIALLVKSGVVLPLWALLPFSLAIGAVGRVIELGLAQTAKRLLSGMNTRKGAVSTPSLTSTANSIP